MFRKEDVRFSAEGGIELSAWLFLPKRQAARLPAITMAHGFAGTKYHGIEPMAEVFAEAGFVVLLHDHCGFGDSDGEPRHDINPWQQITDWADAATRALWGLRAEAESGKRPLCLTMPVDASCTAFTRATSIW